MSKGLWSYIFGDKGYISSRLFNDLFKDNLKLITSICKGIKNKLLELNEKLLLRKRSIIETVNDQLKNISQIEHSRHRSVTNGMIHIISGLIAYTFQENKPSIKKWRVQENLKFSEKEKIVMA